MKYNWNEMSPRERDALVAEKVMGNDYNDPKYFNSSNNNIRVWDDDLPRYTTDIAAAWEVVEKLRPDILLNVQPYGDFWHCKAFTVHMHELAHTRAKSAPEAICLAALRAKGVEI